MLANICVLLVVFQALRTKLLIATGVNQQTYGR